ncbi:MAG TPA: NAD(P)-binding protein, partial [Chitinophagaceae bacterium]|nr:NAD(P)-binding protein [Chitinophagaceae bacterium]
MSKEIIVIGAGACGLYASLLLSRLGKKVTILEARERTGGRIHTISDPSFSLPVESGAEFVHGNLGLTKQLLREAGAEYYKLTGRV